MSNLRIERQDLHDRSAWVMETAKFAVDAAAERLSPTTEQSAGIAVQGAVRAVEIAHKTGKKPGDIVDSVTLRMLERSDLDPAAPEVQAGVVFFRRTMDEAHHMLAELNPVPLPAEVAPQVVERVLVGAGVSR